MSGGECHGPKCKTREYGTKCPHGGLSIRWEIFSPQELARFKELLEKPIKLKPGWPNNENMAT
ncbi:hypothetical protein Gogos_020885 [Gossypium gossypioides]|uniref:Uncharacterized protein n=1 Tax=Gossypium gossypioides TaxID=34282 RepID=A0A7J9CZQ0_GOSGO|nr:hypothetical protein [Gossypium gossypioides]